MNIDYTAISAKAEQRKNALKAIEALLEEAPLRLEQATHVHDYVVRLKTAYAALDQEGRKMLPDNLLKAFEYSSSLFLNSAALVTRSTVNPAYDLHVYASHAPNGA